MVAVAGRRVDKAAGKVVEEATGGGWWRQAG